MRGALLPLLVLAVGCGDTLPLRYRADCLTEIESELPLFEDALTYNVHLAQSLMIQVGAVKSREDFCQQLGSMRIRVFNVDHLPGDIMGQYSIFEGISLTKTTSGLLHEFLHAVNSDHLQPGTAWHEGWDSNGYYDADRSFGFGMKRVYPQQGY